MIQIPLSKLIWLVTFRCARRSSVTTVTFHAFVDCIRSSLRDQYDDGWSSQKFLFRGAASRALCGINSLGTLHRPCNCFGFVVCEFNSRSMSVACDTILRRLRRITYCDYSFVPVKICWLFNFKICPHTCADINPYGHDIHAFSRPLRKPQYFQDIEGHISTQVMIIRRYSLLRSVSCIMHPKWRGNEGVEFVGEGERRSNTISSTYLDLYESTFLIHCVENNSLP